MGPLEGDPHDHTWCGHQWPPWTRLEGAVRSLPSPACGLYRIRGAGKPGLLYIGEGRVHDRLRAHVAKMKQPDHAQGSIFARTAPLECSWVRSDAWLRHQRLELETDLIGAYALATGEVPAA